MQLGPKRCKKLKNEEIENAFLRLEKALLPITFKNQSKKVDNIVERRLY
jgi:hypothetical protein